VTSFFGIKGAFLRFSRKRQDESAPIFFQQCTRPLKLDKNTKHMRTKITASIAENF